MKLTEKDIQLFKSLNNTTLGNNMADYLERLSNWMCDCRNWGNSVDPKAMLLASNHIDNFVVKRIKMSNERKGTNSME